MKYLEPGHVLYQESTGQSVRHGQGRENVVDEVQERLGSGVVAIPGRRVEDGIWLARRGQEP